MSDIEAKQMREPQQPDFSQQEHITAKITTVPGHSKKKVSDILNDNELTEHQKVEMLKAYLG